MKKSKTIVYNIIIFATPIAFLILSLFFIFVANLIKDPSGDDKAYKIIYVFGFVLFCFYFVFSSLGNFINFLQQFSMVAEGTYSKKNTISILISLILLGISILLLVIMIKGLINI